MSNRIITNGFVAICCLSVGCSQSHTKDGAPVAETSPAAAKSPVHVNSPTSADLAWPRAVAEEFLNALLVARDFPAAAMPLTVAYKKSLASALIEQAVFMKQITREDAAAGWRDAEVQGALNSIATYWPNTTWTIESQLSSPQGDEVSFSGKLQPPAKHYYTDGKFTVRLLKEPDSGKWRVDGFMITKKAEE